MEISDSDLTRLIGNLVIREEDKAEFKFKPIFELTSDKKWKEEFAVPAESVLSEFIDRDKIIRRDNYVHLMKLGLFSEFHNEVDFSQKNSDPNGIFSLLPNPNYGVDYDEDEQEEFQFTYQSAGLAGHVNLGAIIHLNFVGQDRTVKFMVSDVTDEDDKIYLKPLSEKFNVNTIRNRRLSSFRIQANERLLKNGLDALSELDEDDSILDVLFPYDIRRFTNCSLTNDSFPLYDPKLNTEQRKAIGRIVSEVNPHPFIIFGPPGTGKSVTVCEAIKQVYNQIPNSFIIVAAHSNVAVDLLVENLIRDINNRKEIIRLVTPSRYMHMPEDIKRFSTTDPYMVQEMRSLRIVCSTLGKLGGLSLYRKATHLFVDEAGQSCEPHVLVPWTKFLSRDHGQVILAGDPMQLRPVVKSEQAQFTKLQISMIERLMEFDLYKRDAMENYNSKYIVQLTKNYRSHEKLLKIPNALFYENRLEACADRIRTQRLCYLDLLPAQGFPYIFQSVHSPHFCLSGSPSLMNNGEVKKVMHWVERLLQSSKIKPDDIGVVTPYKQQEKEIRKNLILRGLHPRISHRYQSQPQFRGVEVGCVEKFQGNEKTVIIYSTVKSKTRLSRIRKKPASGGNGTKPGKISAGNFFLDPKRFNVAVTRAKCLMIFVGDERYVTKSENFVKMIEFIKSYGGFIEATE